MKKILYILTCIILIPGCTSKNQNLNDNQTNHNIDLEKVSQLIENNYLYAKYTLSEIPTNEGNIILDDETYYYLANDIKSFADLKTFVDHIFTNERSEDYYNLLLENKKLVILDNTLYGKTQNKTCDIGNNYDFNNFQVYAQNMEGFSITYENYEYFIYVKNNQYLLADNIFRCLSEK